MRKSEQKQYTDQDFNYGAVTGRLLKYTITMHYAAGIANEICNLERHCRDQFLSKAELDDLMKHYAIRIESKIHAAKVESLKWYLGISFLQLSGVISTIMACIKVLK